MQVLLYFIEWSHEERIFSFSSSSYVDPTTVKKTAKNAFFTEKSRISQISVHARSILGFNWDMYNCL